VIDALARVLPVLLLFLLGAVLRRRAFLAASTVADLRRFVLTVTLPSALFLTFLRVNLELRYLPVVVVVFIACVVMLLIGPSLTRMAGVRSPFAGPLMTGFEAGMLGYAIYGGVFGQENLYRFGIVDLGQVLFVFFILATLLTRRATGVTPRMLDTVAAFIRTPVILAILAGIAGNLVACTTPLIAVVIGYSTTLRRGALSRPARTVVVRLVAWVALALPFSLFVVRGVLGLDPLFAAAVMTMAVLPPPFVIPLYMGGDAGEERDYVADTLSLATVATLIAFSVVAAAFAP
jgi:predicted permease